MPTVEGGLQIYLDFKEQELALWLDPNNGTNATNTTQNGSSNVTEVKIGNNSTNRPSTHFAVALSLLEDQYSDQKQVRVLFNEGLYNSTTNTIQFTNSTAVIRMLDVGSEVNHGGRIV